MNSCRNKKPDQAQEPITVQYRVLSSRVDHPVIQHHPISAAIRPPMTPKEEIANGFKLGLNAMRNFTSNVQQVKNMAVDGTNGITATRFIEKVAGHVLGLDK